MNEETLFEMAVNASEPERAALLDQHCAENPQLRERVEKLLAAHLLPQTNALDPTELQEVLADDAKLTASSGRKPATASKHRSNLDAGSVLAERYTLRELIAEGGMGAVWLASQTTPVKRKVAIKLIKPGMDSRQVIARFEAERQALAVMDHPNIAKVFDGGMTDQGRPYFVMEYVKGVPLTEYCDQARLSVKERLELFIPVCQAVQHAHHKGIVHRDLKPSNILVCLYDGKPVPKVIDFGLAKAMHQPLTEHSILTSHGMMVGTPLYMSPEQAEYNNLDVDTRTDIYSLGVVLYELLTGTTPLEREQLRAAAHNEVLRLIKEVEPLRPSMRLSKSTSLPNIAAQRSIDPRHLGKALSRDLDWVVMKSLAKERTRRYETAAGFARDIENYLNEEAVDAGPPSGTYRLGKYLKKHKLQATASAVMLLALVVGTAAATWGWLKASEAAVIAETSLEQVKQERDAKNAALEKEAAQREMAESALIQGLLRPIGYGGDAELQAFIDWSKLQDDRLKLLVMDIGLKDPNVAPRLLSKAKEISQSCIGLSLDRHNAVCKMLRNTRDNMEHNAQLRQDANIVLLQLGDMERKSIELFVRQLFDPNIRADDARYLSNFIPRLTPKIPLDQRAVICEYLLERKDSLNAEHASYLIRVVIALSSALGEKGQKLRDEYLFWLASILSEGSKSADLSGVYFDGIDFSALANHEGELPQLNPDARLRRWKAVLDCTKASVANYYNGSLDLQDSLIALLPYVSDDDVQELWCLALKESAGMDDIWSTSNLGDWKVEYLNEMIGRLGTEKVRELWDTLNVALPAHSEDGTGSFPYDEREHFSLCCKYFTRAEIDAALVEARAIQFESGKLSGELVLKLNLYGALLSYVDDLDKAEIIRELISMRPTIMLHEDFAYFWLDLIANEVGAGDDESAYKIWHAFTDNVSKEAFSEDFGPGSSDFGIALRPFAAKLTDEQRASECRSLCKRIRSDAVDFSENVAIWALAPHLNNSQRSELWDACWMRLTSDSMEHGFSNISNAMGFLFALLEPNKRNAARALIFERFGSIESHETLLELVGIKNPDDDFERSFAELTDSQFEFLSSILLPTRSNYSDWLIRLENAICSRLSDEQKELRAKEIVQRCVVLSWDSQPTPLRFIRDARFLAETFRNPTIPLSTLQVRLMRFEELVLYEGRNVFLDVSPNKADGKQPVPIRQFLTPHDVAKWIDANWPDFDLDGYGTPSPSVAATASRQ